MRGTSRKLTHGPTRLDGCSYNCPFYVSGTNGHKSRIAYVRETAQSHLFASDGKRKRAREREREKVTNEGKADCALSSLSLSLSFSLSALVDWRQSLLFMDQLRFYHSLFLLLFFRLCLRRWKKKKRRLQITNVIRVFFCI